MNIQINNSVKNEIKYFFVSKCIKYLIFFCTKSKIKKKVNILESAKYLLFDAFRSNKSFIYTA